MESVSYEMANYRSQIFEIQVNSIEQLKTFTLGEECIETPDCNSLTFDILLHDPNGQ